MTVQSNHIRFVLSLGVQHQTAQLTFRADQQPHSQSRHKLATFNNQTGHETQTRNRSPAPPTEGRDLPAEMRRLRHLRLFCVVFSVALCGWTKLYDTKIPLKVLWWKILQWVKVHNEISSDPKTASGPSPQQQQWVEQITLHHTNTLQKKHLCN